MKIAKTAVSLAVVVLALLPPVALSDTSEEKVTPLKPPTSEAQAEAWNLMIGSWYGSQPTQDGGLLERISERFPDGTYKVRFRVHSPDGEVFEQTEVGNWGVSGEIYFAIYRGRVEGEKLIPSDPSDPYNYDAYEIVSLSEERFEYEHVANGNRYVVERVSPDFEFPEQQLQ